MKKDILKYWASWCAPCSTYAPTFEKVKQELSETANFFEINVDEDTQGLVAAHKIKGIPTTVILQDGVEVARQSGILTEEELKNLILSN